MNCSMNFVCGTLEIIKNKKVHYGKSILSNIARKPPKMQFLEGEKNKNFNYQFYVFFNHSNGFSIPKNLYFDINMT